MNRGSLLRGRGRSIRRKQYGKLWLIPCYNVNQKCVIHCIFFFSHSLNEMKNVIQMEYLYYMASHLLVI